MAGPRYVLGWGAVLALAVSASAGTLFFVRQAVGDANLGDPLTQSQVHSAYAAALHPTASATSGPSGSTQPAPTVGSTTTSSGSPGPRPSSSSTPAGGRSTSTGGSTRPAGPTTHPHPSGSSSSSTTRPPSSGSVTRVLTSPGGSVVVRCTAGSGGGLSQVYLVSWSPAQGYSVAHAQRGPGEEAEIEFESDRSSVSVNYRCTATGPEQRVETGDAWGGGGDTGGDGGDGGGSDG